MRKILASSCALCALGVAAFCGPALAQQTPGAASSNSIETVVVTAEKRAQPLQDVPASISVVTAQDIQDRNLNAISDISTRMPNVQIGGSSLYPSITIRGVTSQVSGGNPGFPPAAAVYVDDVYQGRDRATNLPMSGVTQVEVLRGPQGTLYGKDTIAGAINIQTLKPSDEFQAFGDAQVGNLGYEQLTGTISGPVVDDKLDVSLSGIYRHRDGWIHNVYDGQDLNYDRAWGGRLRAIYHATSKLTFDFGADYLDEHDTESDLTTDYSTLALLPFPPFSTTPTFNPETRNESLNSPEYGRRKVHGVYGRFDYDFSGVRLTSISAIRGYTSASAFDTDGTSLNIDNETWTNNASQFSQEIRLTSTSEGPFQWIAGGYFYHENENSNFFLKIHDEFPTFLLGLPALPPGYEDYGQEISQVVENSVAGFISGTYDFTPKLRLAAGLRITQDKKTLHFSQEPSTTASPYSVAQILLVTIPPLTEHLSETEPSFDASLTYKFTPDQVGYIKFARGYKAGGFNVWAVTPPFNPATDSLAFKPEFLSEYEAGFKAAWWNDRVSFNSAVFYDNYTNKQEQEEDPLALSIVVRNAATARIYGAEFELDTVPVEGLTLSATLGLLHGTYTSFPNAGVANACNCFTGNDVALAPDWEGTLAAQYEHEISGWSDHSFFARLEVTHQASSFYDPNNTPLYESKPFTLVNGRIGIESENWGLYAWGKNLTNVYHLTGGDYLLLTHARAVNIPRTFGLELSLKN